ncbi:DUF1192 domain-containing protein [Xanthobacter tagetidis]|uniref:DUF1192 domain-containing protein n=1 Tax=Xanthobacter tagetidis TaxID=60216 RepID=A0A3L7ARD7_9HYPH|nr:DUF1192 domain-containing protein [Xanthobacter tagetidis]RLP81972.1 DUF1192 domain-containing protein [Xanthobacter tagetidis]
MVEEDRPAAAPAPIIGADLSRLSVAEIEARIAELKTEIARLEEALSRKKASLDAANAAFKF